MTVEEIVDEIRSLTPEDRRRIEIALAELRREPPAIDEETRRRGDAAFARLFAGFGTAGGRHLSAGIDEALYGPDR